MFIQVITGKTSDAAGLKQQLDRWQQELQAGSTGWLGTTAGVADDGTFVALARFESEDAARANSDRPEQGEWWAETSKYFDGDPVFSNCSEVDTLGRGGSDDAGFVQIMHGRANDKTKMREGEAAAADRILELRPDLIGSIRGWDGDVFTEAIYFTSEAAAREGEKKMDADAEMAAEFEEFASAMGDVHYIDLKDPWLISP